MSRKRTPKQAKQATLFGQNYADLPYLYAVSHLMYKLMQENVVGLGTDPMRPLVQNLIDASVYIGARHMTDEGHIEAETVENLLATFPPSHTPLARTAIMVGVTIGIEIGYQMAARGIPMPVVPNLHDNQIIFMEDMDGSTGQG